MDFSRMVSPFSWSVCSPAFHSANVHWFCSWIWGWKRLLRCQPRHSLCLGERELPARLSASCQLKEFMTQIQAKHWAEAKKRGREPQLRWRLQCQTASLKQFRGTHHARGLWDFGFMLCFENTHICVHAHSYTLPFSHTHADILLPKILKLLNTPVEKATLGMIIKHLSGPVIAEKSPPDVMIQLACPLVSFCHVSP